ELVSIELRPYLPIPLVRSEVRKDLIKTRARQNVESLLDSLRERILKGELTFEEAAKEYSEGKTAQEGGVMGWVKQEENLGDDPEKAKTFRNELASFSFRQVQGRFTPVTVLEQTVADRIFQMPAGGLTTKLESRYGLHLVTPAELRAGEPKPLDEVKEEIREALVSVFTEEQLKVYYEEHKETYKKPESEEYLPFVEKREEIEKALKKERQDRLIEAWLGEIKRGGQITIIHENLKHLEEL
ncbi:MAG: peptidyl-prolyl cis-trans isomerase, partial [bacterium]|nr:peptidyl-prolyl cis-trans isomerase [bacterium]